MKGVAIRSQPKTMRQRKVTCIVRKTSDTAGVQLQVLRNAVALSQAEQRLKLHEGLAVCAQQLLQIWQAVYPGCTDDAVHGFSGQPRLRQLLLYLNRKGLAYQLSGTRHSAPEPLARLVSTKQQLGYPKGHMSTQPGDDALYGPCQQAASCGSCST